MKIGLVDVDSKNFPNLALMKISAYYKMNGDDVSMYMPVFNYDTVFMSKIFTFTKDFNYVQCENIIKGGTGYNLETVLSKEIDNIYPDYSLYNITDTAYGYLTRGCFRNCNFCIVTKKEGNKIYQVYKLSQFWNGQKNIKLMDSNITGAPNFIDLMDELADTNAMIDFTQGMDLRLLTEKKIEVLKKVKIKLIHFAWDNMEDEKLICSNLKTFIELTGFDYRKIIVYVLINFNTTIEQDLYRINKIKGIGANPYVMVYDKQNADIIHIKLQRYVNNKIIFRSSENLTFQDYISYRNYKDYKKEGKLF